MGDGQTSGDSQTLGNSQTLGDGQTSRNRRDLESGWNLNNPGGEALKLRKWAGPQKMSGNPEIDGILKTVGLQTPAGLRKWRDPWKTTEDQGT